jgi:hypothetical protein
MAALVDQPAVFVQTEEGAMPHVVFGAHSRAYRLYDVKLPYRVPGFGVGVAITKFKQIGVWDKLPHALKDKAKEAKGSWTGLKITQKDLDSIPDDAWQTIAVELGVGWRYATASSGGGRELAAAHG